MKYKISRGTKEMVSQILKAAENRDDSQLNSLLDQVEIRAREMVKSKPMSDFFDVMGPDRIAQSTNIYQKEEI